MKHFKNKFVSIVTVLALCLGLFAPFVTAKGAEKVQPAGTESSAEEKKSTLPDLKSDSDYSFNSNRLIIKPKAELTITQDTEVLGEYDGVYLLGFKNEKKTESAFEYYQEQADAIVPDTALSVAEGGANADGITEMDKENNPFDALEAQVEDATKTAKKEEKEGNDKPLVALIDTGAPKNDKNVVDYATVIGEELYDDNSHGTNMLKTMKSIDKDIRVLSIKALDENGEGNISSVYAAMELAKARGADIINLSLSAKSTEKNAILVDAIKTATDDKIKVVGAAGNDGKDVKDYIPGNIKDVVVAASCNEKGEKIKSSNFGKTVDYMVKSNATSYATATLSGLLSKNKKIDVDYKTVFEANENANGKHLADMESAENAKETSRGDKKDSENNSADNEKKKEQDENKDEKKEEIDPEDGKVRAAGDFTITYNAGSEGKFDNNTTQNIVNYATTQGTITKHSHTPNVSDTGLKNSDYANSLNTNDVVTIPGAGSLNVEIYFNGESISWDYVSIWAGNYPNYTASANYNSTGAVTTAMGATSSTNKYGGSQSGSYTVNGNSLTSMGHMTLTIPGDTVTFGFKSDSSGCGQGYGYYAIVTGSGIIKTITSGTYKEPIPNDPEFRFAGWSPSVDNSTSSMTTTATYTDRLYSGTYDGVPWRIKMDGTLVIGETGQTYTYTNRASRSNSSWPWYNYRAQVTGIEFEGTVNASGSLNGMFYYMQNATYFDGTGFNTTNATSMDYMFQNCSSLASLDVSNFDTSNVTTMNSMFYGCSELTSLDVSSFNTGNVTNMAYMFRDCAALTSLNVSNFNTSKVTNMNNMFNGCSSLTSLNVSNFNTGNVRNMSSMFRHCEAITSLDVSNFNTGNVTNMSSMFEDCASLTSLDVSNFNTGNVTDMSSMFEDCEFITSLDLSNFDTSQVTNMSYMFSDCYTLATIQVSEGWNIGGVTSSTGMFTNCSDLVGGAGTTLDSSYTDKTRAIIDEGTSNPGYLTYKQHDFAPMAYAVFDSSDGSLKFFKDDTGKHYNKQTIGTKTYYTGIETTNYTSNLSIPWYGNRASVTSVTFEDEIRPINTSFWFNGMDNSSFTNIIGLDKLDTSNVTNMAYMFRDCAALTSLNVSNFNTSNVTDMEYMFSNCSALTSLDVSSFDTSNVTDMYRMFYHCDNLTTIYVSDSWDVSGVNDSLNMFSDCTNLVGGEGTAYDSSITDKTRAIIDEGQSNPGYLTYKAAPRRITITKEWDDGLTGSDANNRQTPEVTLNYETTSEPDFSGEAYAVFDSSDGSLKFFRDAIAKYSNGDTAGTKTYYTGLETSTATASSNAPWYSNRESVTSVTFEDNIAPLSTAYWFSGMNNASFTGITGLDKLDTSNVTSMRYMFAHCESLVSLDVSHFDTSNVTDMSYMFGYCYSLMNLNLTHFNTAKITKMIMMFVNCRLLTTELNVMFTNANATNFLGVTQGAATADGAKITLKYVTPGTSNIVDAVLFLSANNGENGGEGTLLPPEPPVSVSRVSDVSDGSNWSKINNDTWAYTFYVSPDADNLEVYESDVPEGYTTTATSENPVAVSNDAATITNSMRSITITKEWEDGLTGSDANNREVPEVTLSYTPVLEGEAYAVFDSSDGSLKFFRDAAGKYSNGDTDGTKTYYTGIEITNYASDSNIPWNDNRASVTSVTFIDEIAPISTAYWFYGMSNASFTSITNLDKLDTSNVTNMYGMFFNCISLTSLNVSNFNTGNVTDMSGMFSGCSSITSLDLSSFNTSSVTNMNSMFAGCSDLTSLNVSNFDTSKVTNMSGIFSSCRAITSLDLSNFDTSKVTNMSGMFNSCTALITIYVSDEWEITGVTSSGSMFYSCTNLVGGNGTRYNSSYIDKTRAIIDEGLSNPGYLTYKIYIPSSSGSPGTASQTFGTVSQTSTSNDWTKVDADTWTYTFYVPSGADNLEVYESSVPEGYSTTATEENPVAVSNNTATITNEKVKSVTITKEWDDGLTGSDAQNREAPEVTLQTAPPEPLTGEAYAVFDSSDGSLKFFRDDAGKYSNGDTDGTKTYYTGIETTNYASASSIPWNSNRTSVTSVTFEDEIAPISTNRWFYGMYNASFTRITGLDKLDTSNVTNMNNMFCNCHNLTSLDLSSFDTSSVTDMSYMFYDCFALASLDLSHFDTSNVTNMSEMLFYCESLTSLDLSSFDTNNVVNMSSMFRNCSSLASLDLGNFNTSNVTNMSYMFGACSALTTVYASDDWDVSGVTYSFFMFDSCPNLVGGQGTAYDSSIVDKTRAKIDGGISDPGYLTYKAYIPTTPPNSANTSSSSGANVSEVSIDTNWTKVDADTWTYTFYVPSGDDDFGVYESSVPEGYTTTATEENPVAVNNDAATITNKIALEQYTIQFDKNASDATGTMRDQTLQVGESAALYTNEFERTGYTFKHWERADIESSVAGPFEDEEVVQDLAESGETVILRAIWEPIHYKVRFNGTDADSGSMADQSFAYGEQQQLSESEFVKQGYTVIGWATEEDGDMVYEDMEEVINLSSTDNDIIDLYAVWDEIRTTYKKANKTADKEEILPGGNIVYTISQKLNDKNKNYTLGDSYSSFSFTDPLSPMVQFQYMDIKLYDKHGNLVDANFIEKGTSDPYDADTHTVFWEPDNLADIPLNGGRLDFIIHVKSINNAPISTQSGN